ncbi:MAG: putative toxin-antitoxin system toxin component, PIN family [Acidobacteriaceae bacterium]|nr:putative toxin-antitoxin system toxin component, PIN family [Acidobacteriaceae bacterium]
MKVCLDTNVLVAALATRGLCADVLRTVLAEHELVIGAVILAELRRILTTKFKVPSEQVNRIEAIFAPFPLLPKPAAPSTVKVRDASDRWILATALTGGAEVLVTGDEDLLAVAEDVPIHILTPRAFWELLRQSSPG